MLGILYAGRTMISYNVTNNVTNNAGSVASLLSQPDEMGSMKHEALTFSGA
jgi:hypothetical protein